MKGLETIDNPNDRCILFILGLFKDKGRKDKKRFDKLSKRYPTNHLFESQIEQFLFDMNFLKRENDDCTENEFGQKIYIDEPIIDLTKEGILAYKNGFFQSELDENRREYFKIKLSNFSIAIAIIGGIAGVITSLITIYTYFCK